MGSDATRWTGVGVLRLNEYLDSHLLAMQLAATAPLVMTSEANAVPDISNVAVTNRDGAAPTPPAASNISLQYSQILKIPVGKKLEALNLQYPQAGFDTAVKTTLMSIATALNVTYSQLTSDSAGESHSTIRFGSQSSTDHWKAVQVWFSRQFHKKVYMAWLEQALLMGVLDLPSDEPEDYHSVTFRPKGFRYADFSKDIKAYVEGINNGLYTRSYVLAELGLNYQDVILELAAERKFAEEHGIVFQSTKDASVESVINELLPQAA